ncbi:MAG: class II fructose-bisphosphatase [Acetobacter sp.]|nr:class II fructose-bisphosphatase [Acetobacter sp.]
MSVSSHSTSFVENTIAFDLVRVTEAAALASAQWVGRGCKNDADGAAVEAMRKAFDNLAIDGVVVIGEGEMDEAPMLYVGEKVGCGGVPMDIAVDPLEGTTLCAKAMPNAITVLALAERGKLLHAPDIYMDKIVVGTGLPEGVVDLDASIENNLKNLAQAKRKPVQDLVLCTLERERHQDLIARARAVGARVQLLTDGDVAGGMAASLTTSDVDIYVGSGGAPEGVLTAAAIRCLGGQMQGRLLFENEMQRQRAQAMNPGQDPSRKLGLHDMAAGSVLFSATGVTTGALLRGVSYHKGHSQAITHSLVMCASSGSHSGIIRFIETYHQC